MARRLVSSGHEVHMVTTDQSESRAGQSSWRLTNEAGIHVHWAAVPYNNKMSYWQRVSAFLRFAYLSMWKARSLKPDLIFATSTPLTIAIPAILASRSIRCPMVFEVRDLWPAVPIAIGALRNPLLKYMARLLEKAAYRNASYVVALAPGMRDEIVKLGYPASQVMVIPNGCDLDLFEAGDGAAVRARYSWLGSRPTLLFCGAFGLVNGVDYLARLAQAILAIDVEIRIVAIGAGREYGNVVGLAKSLGVYERNMFFMGSLPKVDTVEWLAASNMTIALFTGPSIVWRDAVQNKFFDSIAAGRPVVNNFPGWQAQVAVEAGAGLIVSAVDIQQAARDIVDVLRNSQWQLAAQAACRKLAKERFDRDLLAEKLESVLLQVIKGRTNHVS